MVSGIFHSGSGIGNQLHRYVATRVLALDKGYEFSMVAPENCKVKSFMNLDMGVKVPLPYRVEMPAGKVIPMAMPKRISVKLDFDPYTTSDASGINLWEEKTNYYNPEFNFIEDNTIIDGEFQDERYFGHRMKEIDGWLKVRDDAILETGKFTDEHCVIGFRGGEYALFPELFLTREYWDLAIEMMKGRGVKRFFVVSDDTETAKKFFPDFQVTHEIGHDWNAVRECPNSIIANSSFYILPRLLNGGITIAPRYWARRNTKEWSMPQNYYKKFIYI